MFLEVCADLLGRGYSVRFRPGGHSMSPTIRDGEAVTVEPVEPCEVRKGDIILYRTASSVIAHRVMLIESREDAGPIFHLRGDASSSFDAPVSAEQVLGAVVSVERNGRLISLAGMSARAISAARLHLFRLKARLWANLNRLSARNAR
jgi:signal peptidase I